MPPPPPAHSSRQSPPSAAHTTGASTPNNLSNVDPSVLRLHLNQLREEEMIARLRERQHQQHYSAAMSPQSHLTSSYMSQSQNDAHYPHAAAAATTAATMMSPNLSSSLQQSPLDLFLAAPARQHQHQHQQQQFIPGAPSPDLFLELVRQRPDLLASLQAQQQRILSPNASPLNNTMAHAHDGGFAGASPTTVKASTPRTPSSQPLSRPKRKRPRETSVSGDKHIQEDSYASTKSNEEVEEECSDDRKEPSLPRPRKRVIFDIGELGEVGTGDDNDDHDAEPWHLESHRKMVEAVFETGIRHASPSVLLNLMANALNFPLTSERVKSRLQKYRNNADKSKNDFMEEYDAFLQRAMSIGSQSTTTNKRAQLLPISRVVQIMGQENEALYGGVAAAAATYEIFVRSGGGSSGGVGGRGAFDSHGSARQRHSTSMAGEARFDSTVQNLLTPSVLKQGSESLAQNCDGQSLEMPRLTDEEKASPLGACLNNVMGTFAALFKELEQQRAGSQSSAQSVASSKEDPANSKISSDITVAAARFHEDKASEKTESGASSAVEKEIETVGEDSQQKSSSFQANNSNEKGKDEIGALVSLMYKSQKDKQPTSKF